MPLDFLLPQGLVLCSSSNIKIYAHTLIETDLKSELEMFHAHQLFMNTSANTPAILLSRDQKEVAQLSGILNSHIWQEAGK